MAVETGPIELYLLPGAFAEATREVSDIVLDPGITAEIAAIETSNLEVAAGGLAIVLTSKEDWEQPAPHLVRPEHLRSGKAYPSSLKKLERRPTVIVAPGPWTEESLLERLQEALFTERDRLNQPRNAEQTALDIGAGVMTGSVALIGYGFNLTPAGLVAGAVGAGGYLAYRRWYKHRRQQAVDALDQEAGEVPNPFIVVPRH